MLELMILATTIAQEQDLGRSNKAKIETVDENSRGKCLATPRSLGKWLYVRSKEEFQSSLSEISIIVYDNSKYKTLLSSMEAFSRTIGEISCEDGIQVAYVDCYTYESICILAQTTSLPSVGVMFNSHTTYKPIQSAAELQTEAKILTNQLMDIIQRKKLAFSKAESLVEETSGDQRKKQLKDKSKSFWLLLIPSLILVALTCLALFGKVGEKQRNPDHNSFQIEMKAMTESEAADANLNNQPLLLM